MTHRFLFFLLCAITCVPSVFAQSAADAARSINAIKRDTTYLYAEATTSNLDTALYNAKAILEVKVQDWVREQHPNEGIEVCIAKAKEHSFDVRTRRGNLQRAFVYVRKSDILPIANRSEVMVFEVEKESEPVQATTPVEVLSEDTQITEPEPESEPEPEPVITLTVQEQKILGIASLDDLNTFLTPYRRQSRLNGYGKYSTMPKDADCHIVICDAQGQVIARFRHQSNGKVFNLNTLKTDAVESYGHGAIWFQLKD